MRNVIDILHGFKSDIPEYLLRGDKKALECYVARCRRVVSFKFLEAFIVFKKYKPSDKKINILYIFILRRSIKSNEMIQPQ